MMVLDQELLARCDLLQVDLGTQRRKLTEQIGKLAANEVSNHAQHLMVAVAKLAHLEHRLADLLAWEGIR